MDDEKNSERFIKIPKAPLEEIWDIFAAVVFGRPVSPRQE